MQIFGFGDFFDTRTGRIWHYVWDDKKKQYVLRSKYRLINLGDPWITESLE